VAAIVEKLDRAGVTLVSVRESWADTSGPAAISSSPSAWVAQQERARLLERLAAPRARLEKEGRHWGRPCRMSDTPVEHARELRTAGRSFRQVAVALKVPSSTIRRALCRSS